MATMVHMNTARTILESGNAVDVKFWEKDGTIVSANNVICTSTYYRNNTANLKFRESGEFRKVRMITIFEINGMEVFL